MSVLRFTDDHEWIRMDGGNVGVVGITAHAAEQLGDLVFVELPEPGRRVESGDEVAVIESVKVAADCKAPVSGTVTEVNEALVDEPGLVNEDAMGRGWFFKLEVDEPSAVESLMDEQAYEASIAE
jgi:glycine cleavage system H protein